MVSLRRLKGANRTQVVDDWPLFVPPAGMGARRRQDIEDRRQGQAAGVPLLALSAMTAVLALSGAS
jgi:hypothetical protein